MAENFSTDEATSALNACWFDGTTGSFQVGEGRYVQWARWPDGVQLECSSDAFWTEGELTFLQRRILAKLGFHAPDADVPHYYLRVTDEEDLVEAAGALVRCVEEVLALPRLEAGHPVRPELGPALLRCFGSQGLPYPYVPAFAVDELYVIPPSTFTTYEAVPKELYLMQEALDELLAPKVDRRFAVSYWGHGMNSYAWTVHLQRPGLRLLAQCHFGGVFPNSDQDVQIAGLFELGRKVDALVPRNIDRDIVVVQSRMRDIAAAGYAPAGAQLRNDWLEENGADDLLERIGTLLTGEAETPESPWERLTEAFYYSLLRVQALGADLEVLEPPGYVIHLQTEGPDQRICVKIMTTDELPEHQMISPHQHDVLRDLGWITTPELRNRHLVVQGKDQFRPAAEAMVGAVRLVWSMDPLKAAKDVFARAGGDDNNGEWV